MRVLRSAATPPDASTGAASPETTSAAPAIAKVHVAEFGCTQLAPDSIGNSWVSHAVVVRNLGSTEVASDVDLNVASHNASGAVVDSWDAAPARVGGFETSGVLTVPNDFGMTTTGTVHSTFAEQLERVSAVAGLSSTAAARSRMWPTPR